MKLTRIESTFAVLGRVVLGTGLMLSVLVAHPRMSQGAELIPSIGATKSTDSDAGDAQFFGGLGLRVPLLPFLKAEVGISYRQDSFFDDNLKVKQWPITTSLWLSPLPVLYVGGGVGWYKTTFDYADGFPIEDTTDSQMGAHLGGGLNIPLSPRVGLDLNGRYIFMKQGDESLVPQEFDPDFWSTSAGLAIRF